MEHAINSITDQNDELKRMNYHITAEIPRELSTLLLSIPVDVVYLFFFNYLKIIMTELLNAIPKRKIKLVIPSSTMA